MPVAQFGLHVLGSPTCVPQGTSIQQSNLSLRPVPRTLTVIHMVNAHGTDCKHGELHRNWCGNGMHTDNSVRIIHCEIHMDS